MNNTERITKMRLALELVLLFHGNGPWDDYKRQAWSNGLTELLGVAFSREDYPTNEATTKNLCNAVRKALE